MNDLPRLMVDTNIVSYIMKGDRYAEMYAKDLLGKSLAIAFVTVGELYFGAEKKKWGDKRRKKLETILRNFIHIPYDQEIARCYGLLLAECYRKGKAIETNDAWIAACAVRHKIVLVTHNPKHFVDVTGLQIFTKYVKGEG